MHPNFEGPLWGGPVRAVDRSWPFFTDSQNSPQSNGTMRALSGTRKTHHDCEKSLDMSFQSATMRAHAAAYCVLRPCARTPPRIVCGSVLCIRCSRSTSSCGPSAVSRSWASPPELQRYPLLSMLVSLSFWDRLLNHLSMAFVSTEVWFEEGGLPQSPPDRRSPTHGALWACLGPSWRRLRLG